MSVLRICLVLLAVHFVVARSGGFEQDSHDRSLLVVGEDWSHKWSKDTLEEAWKKFHHSDSNVKVEPDRHWKKFDFHDWSDWVKHDKPEPSVQHKDFPDFFVFLKTKFGKGRD